MLKELVKERLMAAADEIFALFEATIASYEKELSRTRQKARHLQSIEDVHQLSGAQERRPSLSPLKPEDPQPPHIKEEEEEEEDWINQEEDYIPGPKEADLTKMPPTGVPVKNDEDITTESSHLHRSPSEENGGVEPSSSSSTQHLTAEAEEDHFGAPLSDNEDMSQSMECKDWNDIKDTLSSDTDCEGDMTTQTNKRCKKEVTGEKSFTCSDCAKVFSRLSVFLQHMRTHTGEKPFLCSICGERFALMWNMKAHMRIHKREKPFKCSVCGQTFSIKANMVSHMRTHTGEKPFVCLVCVKTFAHKANLVSHMRTHTGEKPFMCSFCAKTFSHKANMVTHMRTHTGEKPYKCSVCSDSFAQGSALNRHLRIHTGEKPFQCSVCVKTFSSKTNMLTHMKTHASEMMHLLNGPL
ncbi:gastrula zinc finger protein xFG20-1-like isoform X2 [Nerophis ophidion]|uniref:gastrula zinc finger protein xFG20-1-like isoform X2 n=1 Tax=Nerophis ophidion TaxID=159077 RepID=UPI002ADFDDF2|nr:gastrula zinc finger protein xFG20-1-like isoform X2 [Nerophis ophidion]